MQAIANSHGTILPVLNTCITDSGNSTIQSTSGMPASRPETNTGTGLRRNLNENPVQAR